jgi:hypothetical protein
VKLVLIGVCEKLTVQRTHISHARPSALLPCTNTLLLSAKYKKSSELYVHIG